MNEKTESMTLRTKQAPITKDPSSRTPIVSPLLSKKSASPKRHTNNEVNYEINPTKLYTYIEQKNWKKVIQRCQDIPSEAAIAVYRIDTTTNKLRWRQLPIHAAMIFQASNQAVSELIEAYPQGVYTPDDQGMLPTHLAFRYHAGETVINYLLATYPESVQRKDKKGRIPIHLMKPKNHLNHVSLLRNYFFQYQNDLKKSVIEAQSVILKKEKNSLTGKYEDKLEETEAKYKERIKELETDFQKKEDAHNLKMKEIKDEIGNNIEMLGEATEKINKQDSKIILLQEELERFKDRSEEFSKEKDDMEKRLQEQETEIENIKSGHSKQMEQLQNKNNELSEQANALQSEKKQMQSSFTALQNGNEKMMSMYDDKIQQLQQQELHQKNTMETNDLESKAKIEMLENKVTELTHAYVDAKSQNQEKDARMKDLEQASEVLLQRIQTLESELTKEQNTNKDLVRKLGQMSLDEKKLMNRTQDLTNNLVKRSVEKRNLIKKYESEISTLLTENRNLQRMRR